MAEQEQGNIKQEYNSAQTGMNMDLVPSLLPKGTLSYALNAAVENYDGQGVEYQNEPGNELCVEFPESFVLIGKHFIAEQNKHIFFLANPISGDSQIGYMENNDCLYHILVDAVCLNFSVLHPIHKIVHKITNCSTEIYWTDGYNPRRYLDIDNIPKIIRYGTPLCSPIYTSEIDCNQLKVQPNFDLPLLEITDVINGGNLISGTYQFGIQYSDAQGNPFTSYYSITNPTPIADEHITSNDFNYPVGRSIVINVSNLDTTGLYEYFNIAVVKTINAATLVELVGTYYIDKEEKSIIYTGQNLTQIKLAIEDIFEKFPFYDIADDLTTAQDILIWDDLKTIERTNYQHIANQIELQWETWRIPATENYADEVNATNLRGYTRDEIYPFEIVFLLGNGKETDGFHIPGRIKNLNETTRPDIAETNDDFIGEPTYYSGGVGYSPYWKIYNTASVKGYSTGYSAYPSYKGPYQYGEFAYWESTEEYPCNTEIWGDLAGQKIRHHKFPDVAVSPIFESKVFSGISSMEMGNEAVFPIGVKISPSQVLQLIQTSSLTQEQKDEIVGFKIVRGDRTTNKSIVAKGILRNVNSYTRDGKEYYFPNYPYNDLGEDPFINKTNNAYSDECEAFTVDITNLYYDPNVGYERALVQYVDCNTNESGTKEYLTLGEQPQLCSIGKPVISFGKGTVSYIDYDLWRITAGFIGGRVEYEDITEGIKSEWVDNTIKEVKVVVGSSPACLVGCAFITTEFIGTYITSTSCANPDPIPTVVDKYRQVFNSPETSFGQPFLGNILKLESVIFGAGIAHFDEVKKEAKYRLISKEAQQKALDSASALADITSDFDVPSLFAAYDAYLQIYLNQITRKNYAYSFNSIASYDYTNSVPNDLGIKQRNIDLAQYLIPSVVSTGDVNEVNNWQRESSVYIKTEEELPFPSESPNMLSGIIPIVTDNSRFTISETGNCDKPGEKRPIQAVSYYASLKNDFVNQWGQIYSYQAIDTGYSYIFGVSDNTVIFGGDTFISRFAFKTKLPFFIDNRVGAPDDSDIFYDEIGNVGYPKYWHSSRSIMDNYTPKSSHDSIGTLVNFISYKAHNFDCPNDTSISSSVPSSTTTTTTTNSITTGEVTSGNAEVTYYDGYFYLFAYGVPYFYCESSYNTDLRQAFNNKEGDFWPHVTNSIPDDWVQENFVSIQNDNTYFYNSSLSKQNKEDSITHLPFDWNAVCMKSFPFRGIYSEPQVEAADNRVNAWRIYRATSYFDFPQNYGALTSLDGIQNKAILARFENKTLLYGNLLTMDTSNPQAAWLGNPQLFKGAPPIDFADTDLGYAGSQHKFLLKIPQGQISIDAKRGQIFLIQGTSAIDITGFGSGVNRFMTDHLSFEIENYFPGIDVDNHYNGIGLHGVYDAKYDRVIITKLDYVPLSTDIKYENYEFYIENELGTHIIIDLLDQDYFCNKSWTASYNINTKSWISFHSYLPNWYIGENNFFYSGMNSCCEDFEFIAGELPLPFDCNLYGYAWIDGCPFDCDLEAIACLVTTTTTTTTVRATTTTTSSSTLYPPCALEGDATELCPSTTTTSTTECVRPEGLEMLSFITGYTDHGNPIGSTATEELACSALTVLKNNVDEEVTPIYILVEVTDGINIGSHVFLYNGTDDCECIEDGWYFTGESIYYCYVFHVTDCVIDEIVDCCATTTTTTMYCPLDGGLEEVICENITSTTTTTTICIGCIDYLLENVVESDVPTIFDVTLCNGSDIEVDVYNGLGQILCTESVTPEEPEVGTITFIDCCDEGACDLEGTAEEVCTTTTTTTIEPTTTTTTTEEATTTTTTTTEEPTTTTTSTTEEVTTTTTSTTEEGTTTTTTTSGETTTTTTTEEGTTTTTTTIEGETTTTTTSTTGEVTTTTTTTLAPTTTTTTSTSPVTTTTTTTSALCIPDCNWGFLYNFYAVVDPREIAPLGWHVPTVAEFNTLITNAGGNVTGGGHLKIDGTSYWNVDNADNSTGFSAVGAGIRAGNNGVYKWQKHTTYIATSDFYVVGATPYIGILNLDATHTNVHTSYTSAIDYGISVRLVKDNDVYEGMMADNDGHCYPTVKIGNQVWMAQNLGTTTYRDGSPITGPIFTNAEWKDLITEGYCVYDDCIPECPLCTTTTTSTTGLPTTTTTSTTSGPTTTTTSTTCYLFIDIVDIICEDVTTTTTTSTTAECDIELIFLEILFDTTTTTSTSTTSTSTTSTSSSTTTSTTTIEPTTTTTTTAEVTTTTTSTTEEVTTTTTSTTVEPTTTTSTTLEPTTTTTTTFIPEFYAGALYNFYAVDNANNIAPTGWHVPSRTEWNTLFQYLVDNFYYCDSDTDYISKSIAANTDWDTSGETCAVGNNLSENNSTCFSALPTGMRYAYGGSMGNYDNLFNGFRCWTSTASGTPGYAWEKEISSHNGWTGENELNKPYGCTVRLIRDSISGWIEGEQITDYDSNIYDTIKIGDQVWSQQNFICTHYRNGVLIPELADQTAWNADTTGAICYYENHPEYGDVPSIICTQVVPTTTTTTTLAPTTTTTTTTSP